MSSALGSDPSASVRLDKWLWAVRLYKTRNDATEACRRGQVTQNGQVAKPSRSIKAGEVFQIQLTWLTRRVRVRAVLERRVGAKLVPDYMEDLTPPEDIARARERQTEARLAAPRFEPGLGRPTKAQRRALEKWHAASLGDPLGEEE